VSGPSPGRDPAELSREELVELGMRLDGVRVVAHEPAHRSAGPRGERRSRRRVSVLLALSVLFGLLFAVVYVAWPNGYVPPSDPAHGLYLLYTPLLGVLFAASVGALGVGMITYVKSFYPDEVAVQEREGGPSSEVDRTTAVATLADAAEDVGIGRRPLIRRLGLGGLGVFALMGGLMALGGVVRDPWRGGADAPLWRTGWKAVGGETVYLRIATGNPDEITRIRPQDMEPGSVQTVVPFRESERGNTEALLAAENAADAPVMLIRLHPGTPVRNRPGQEDLHHPDPGGDFYAFSRVCTHLGCPASLYDAERRAALCPCHQSEFQIDDGAVPVFGPATRPLPQLPVTLDEQGWFIARDDFPEPVGPAFWEIRSH
jgi:ubiquinol-cytochrome c reductase iron-sulfur subunit